MRGMRPPDCYVCHRTLNDFPGEGARRDYFTLIYFGETEREKLGSARPEGWTGHRSTAVWFCNDHAVIAREHENRHCSDALAAINAQLKASGEGRPAPS
jgi:hypothetical protein